MNRQRPQNDDKILSLFTSGQLVAGLCTLIFYTVLIFLIGVVVGRMDPSGKEARLAEKKQDVVVSSPGKSITEKNLEKPEVKGKQTSPRPPATGSEAKPAEKTKESPKTDEKPAAPAREVKTLQKNTQSHPTMIPNTPAPRVKPPMADAPKAPAETTTPKETTAAPVKAEEVKTATAKAEKAAAVKAVETKPAAVKPAEALEPPAAATKKAPEPVVIPGNYAVQVAAFTDTLRKDKAAQFLSVLHKDKLNAISMPAKNGTVYRLLVVGFKNEEDAKSRCLEIQKMSKDYSKAYARKLYPEEEKYLTQGSTP